MKERKWKHRHPQKSFSRDQRKEQIMGQFSIWQSKNDTEPKTMNRIAKALGMTPSPHVRDILLEMVADGKLGFKEHDQKGKWTARDYYSVVKVLITEKCLRRTISVRKRGVAVGQMDMFS